MSRKKKNSKENPSQEKNIAVQISHVLGGKRLKKQENGVTAVEGERQGFVFCFWTVEYFEKRSKGIFVFNQVMSLFSILRKTTESIGKKNSPDNFFPKLSTSNF